MSDLKQYYVDCDAAELANEFSRIAIRLQEESAAHEHLHHHHHYRRSGDILVDTLVRMFGRSLAAIGIVKFLSDTSGLVTPFILGLLVKNIKDISKLTGDTPERQILMFWGLGYCITLFLMQMIHSISQHNYQRVSMHSALKSRVAISSAIFEKALKLSGRARHDFTVGQIVNMMSSDALRIEQFVAFLHYIWSAPYQMTFIMIMLYRLLGWGAFISLLFYVLVVIPLQRFLTTKISSYRGESAGLCDQRIRLMQELVQSIRIIKLYAWEDPFLKNLTEIRDNETRLVQKKEFCRSVISGLAFMVPIISGVLTLVIYYLIGGPFVAEVVFPAIAYFNSMRQPLNVVPLILSTYAEASIASKRINSFLSAEENTFSPIVDKGLPVAVLVENADFIWENSTNGGGGGFTETVPETQVKPSKASRVSTIALLDEKEESKIRKSEDDSNKDETTEDKLISIVSGKQDQRLIELCPPPIDSSLLNVNFQIEKGSLVMIVGQIGSGKSSLLNALIGEMRCIRGNVAFCGSIGYCSQQAWIQNTTLRENILFGKSFNEPRYRSVIRACALQSDLAILEKGDATLIGEKGANISGGQKQRINLARTVYSGADIVLMDDPLSAVDAHVSRILFEQCICGPLMNRRTRLLVTHQLQLLDQANLIIVMHNGHIEETGSYSDLVSKSNGMLTTMLKNVHLETEIQKPTPIIPLKDITSPFMQHQRTDSLERLGRQTGHRQGKREDSVNSIRSGGATPNMLSSTQIEVTETNDGIQNDSAPIVAAFSTVEERATGVTSIRVYLDYARNCGGLTFIFVTVVLLSGLQSCRIFSDLLLKNWVTSVTIRKDNMWYSGLYSAGGCMQAALVLIYGIFFVKGGINAARSLHGRALMGIARSPVRFFDANPTGRIMNRFSRDTDLVDNQLAEAFRQFALMASSMIATLIVISTASPILMVMFAPLTVVYYWIQGQFRPAARDLKRIESVSRSPLYSHFYETLTGLPTIRAMCEQSRFHAQNHTFLDANSRPAWLQICLQRWLPLRLEVVAYTASLITSLACYLGKVDAELAGLAISTSLGITYLLNWTTRWIAELEGHIISAERLMHYAEKLQVEGSEVMAPFENAIVPPSDWPSKGQIDIERLVLQYREDMEPSIKGVTLHINAGERIGIVGRTGAGKSSVVMALFRMVEAREGRIIIDDLDISKLDLQRLRKQLAIIPQDPVVFEGSIRSNLDPFNEHDDAAIWNALHLAHLDAAVKEMDGRLLAYVEPNGDNLSVGQRQLLCLGRALLKGSRILVLDEATASVDMETDLLIQQCIRQNFRTCTIVTVAHRIGTVMDYDRIVVLDRGVVIEFGSPKELLSNPLSTFSGLVRESAEKTQQ